MTLRWKLATKSRWLDVMEEEMAEDDLLRARLPQHGHKPKRLQQNVRVRIKTINRLRGYLQSREISHER